MIENLETDLARVVCLYRNRKELFKWNGEDAAFNLRDVIRHTLFTRAEAAGFTPVPNVHTLNWRVDLMCLRGLRLEQVYVVRTNLEDDYRGLLLFPKSIERVLVISHDSLIPEDCSEFTTILIPKQPTSNVTSALPVNKVLDDYASAFTEVYGFDCVYTRSQLINGAAKVAGFWVGFGKDLDLREYFVWRMNRTRAQVGVGDTRVLHLIDMLSKDEFTKFKLEKQSGTYKAEWTVGGWGSLDSKRN